MCVWNNCSLAGGRNNGPRAPSCVHVQFSSVAQFYLTDWNSSTLATSCEELTHWKRLWCWEGLGAGGEGDNKGWDGWMASLTQWTWVNSGSWWWTGRTGVLRFMGSQRVRHDWVTELNWIELWPLGLQHARLPCPLPTPGACPNSCPSSRWYHPTISSSVVSFSSLQSFPASGSFPMSQFFALGGQVLQFQLQHQSFQWIFRTDFL